MEGYISRYDFPVIRHKPWQSHPGGQILELAICPFNAAHVDGSAAFTMENGVPGFTCKHNGCHSKTIKDVFIVRPPQPREYSAPAMLGAKVKLEEDEPARKVWPPRLPSIVWTGVFQ